MAAVTGEPTSNAKSRAISTFGMIIFLASDVMVFAAFFAAYFLLRSTNDPWPAVGVELDTVRASLATVALVASSFTMAAGERCHHRGDSVGLRKWLLATMALGGAFLINQLAEYASLPFRIDSHVYGSTYWGLTGLHTAHVAAGVVALGLLFVRAARASNTTDTDTWVSATSAFWHLVDVIWVFVFLTIFIVR